MFLAKATRADNTACLTVNHAVHFFGHAPAGPVISVIDPRERNSSR